jgi:hypothetical protein
VVIQAFIRWLSGANRSWRPRRYLHRNDDNSGWFSGWNYSLRWIQSLVKTDKIVHQMEANAVDF